MSLHASSQRGRFALGVLSKNRIRRMPVTGKTVFVLAHPDDETITGVGYLGKIGRLARFQALNRLLNGVNQWSSKLPSLFGLSEQLSKVRAIEKPVAYYATLGEKGNHNGVREEEDLGVVRSDEFQEVKKILGMDVKIGRSSEHNFHDSGLGEVHAELVQSILAFLEQEKPTRVITFPPLGITNHDDHKAISVATTEVVMMYNRTNPNQPLALFYRVIDRHEQGIAGPFIFYDDLPITHTSKVSRMFSKRRIAEVIQAHRTQVPEMGTIFAAFEKYAKNPLRPPNYNGNIKKIWNKETFYQKI